MRFVDCDGDNVTLPQTWVGASGAPASVAAGLRYGRLFARRVLTSAASGADRVLARPERSANA